ncbi:MAG: regulatory protein GemA [Desulfobacterales bacterium]|nr:regulatory protein GemA [Desulfobacterales bacterium]
MNRGQLAVIHIAKKQVGMTEEEYLDLLGSVRVESAKDLTPKTFNIVMNHFEQLGFVSKSKSRSKRRVENPATEKEALMGKLEALILATGKSWAYVDGIAKKRFKVESVRFLDTTALYKVVQMMAVYQARHQTPAKRRKG